MNYLGIDYGKKRVGIAYSDETGKVAFPLAILPNNENLVAQICGIAMDKKTNLIVLGESNNLDGTPNAIMKDIEVFKKNLSEISGIEIHYEPEFWSSFQAERWQGKTEHVDASAAAIILQSFLDKK